MRKAYKFRLYPTRQQTQVLAATLDTHRRLYNAALEQRRAAWSKCHVTLNYYAQANELKGIRLVDRDLANTNYSSLQATLRRLEKAFQAFFRRVKAGQRAGYPRFKGIDRFDSVEYPSYGNGCRFDGKRTYVQPVGWVKTKVHRAPEGRIKTITVKREAGRWYVMLSCDLGEDAVELRTGPAVGIDLGLSTFVTTSDGEAIAPPQFYRKAQAMLCRAQRSLSRKERGSKRRLKARWRVTQIHWHVANQRRDWHHKTALALTRRYATLIHEDLNIIGIARTRLAKSTLDAGWGQFLAILDCKAAEAGCQVLVVSPRNTSQVCSDCGALPAIALTLKDRIYACEHCGFTSDRDVNAAKNILRLGSSRQALTPAVARVA